MGTPEQAASWFSEGFTDFYKVRTLVRGGLWTPEQAVAFLNTALADDALSPVRSAPNSRIVEAFWTDPDVSRLPYHRGLLFALLTEWHLRQKDHSLDEVIAGMQRRWAAAPADSKPLLIDSFLKESATLGVGLRPLVVRHIDRGEPIALPADALGSCALVETVEQPRFELGYDPAGSQAVFSGVDPASNAYAAGLRDGMKRLDVTSSEWGDVTVPITAVVRDGGTERTISWLPAGKRLFPVQRIRLSAPATATCPI